MLRSVGIWRFCFGLMLLAGFCLAPVNAQESRKQQSLGEVAKRLFMRSVRGAYPTIALDDLNAESRRLYVKAAQLVRKGNDLAAAIALDRAWANDGDKVFEVALLRARVDHRLERRSFQQSIDSALAIRNHDIDAQYLKGMGAASESKDVACYFGPAALAAETSPNNPLGTAAWFRLGKGLENLGYFRAAAEAYTEFEETLVFVSPEHRENEAIQAILKGYPAGVLGKVLECYRKAELADRAVSTIAMFLEDRPEDLFYRRVYVEALVAADRDEDAWEYCQKNFVGREHLALRVGIARRLGRLESWIAEIAASANESRTSRDLLSWIAYRCWLDGDMAHDAMAARVVGEADPETLLDVGLWLGAIEVLEGDPDKGVATIARYAERAHYGGLADFTELCDIDRRIKDDGPLREMLDKYTDHLPTQKGEAFAIGVLAAAADRAVLATRCFDVCKKADPSCELFAIVGPEFSVVRRKWERVIEEIRPICDAHDSWISARFLLGYAHANLDHSDEADAAFKIVAKKAPADVTKLLAIGHHYMTGWKHEASQRYYQQAFDADPSCGDALAMLVNAYLSNGKLELARRVAARADREAIESSLLWIVDFQLRVARLIKAVHPGAADLRVSTLKSPVNELHRRFATFPEDRWVSSWLAYWASYQEDWEAVADAFSHVSEDERMRFDSYESVKYWDGAIAKETYNLPQAIEHFGELVQAYPNRTIYLWHLAEVCCGEFQWKRERACLNHLIEITPWQGYRSAAIKKLIGSYSRAGEFDEALKAVKRIENVEERRRAKWHVLERAKRYDEAIAVVEEIIKNPEESNVSSEAKAPRIGLIDILIQAERHAEAESRIRQWERNSGNEADLAKKMVEIFIKAERAKEGLEYANALALDDDERFVKDLCLARCQAANGDWPAAKSSYEKALDGCVSAYGDMEDLIFFLAKDAIACDKVDDAIDLCREIVDQFESQMIEGMADRYADWQYGGVLRGFGALLDGQERVDEWVVICEKERWHDAKYVRPKNDLAYAYAVAGVELDTAEKLVKQVLMDYPAETAYLDTLGWVYYKKGDFESAYKYIDRAFRADVGVADYVGLDHLGDIQYRLGNIDAAKKAWAQAVELFEEGKFSDLLVDPDDRLAKLQEKLASAERQESVKVAPTATEQHKESQREDTSRNR